MVSLPLLAALAVGHSGPQPATFTGAVVKQVTLNYLVNLPEGYGKGRKRWPLILFLHGAGERGTDLEQLKVHGPMKEIVAGRKLPFVVVAPQCPPGQWWDPDTVSGLLDHVERTYRIDKDRIYLTGLSMGGYGTWALAIQQPARFAAIAPICGGGDPKQAAVLKDLPIWVTHGDADGAVPIKQSIDMVEAIKKTGGNPIFDIIPGGEHDVWTPVYRSEGLYQWFLRHKRGQKGG